ncbi:hypothetical protein ABEP17_01570 [Priestia flexa]|uniref:Uncharacterized protein n=2 Tax=Priestia TaxID=2800373 RepID=A0A0V8JMU7_9BACI|nr:MULTISPECIES: hypothetical protein [Bacillaceae]AQX54420.1 hypothetical protein BC359_08965 [Priestia flexa]KSU88370.1 hypothetical protein AS180_08000 [Priestia veravalensis]KZB91768.1 hypothetical protein A2U94_08660 [Bacillus sp. VT 712]MCA1203005.1 hypothetical protein [Priestia flexa]MCG7314540.1 hypothetical protein [Priestia flexa]
MNGQQLLYSLLTANGQGLQSAFVISKHKISKLQPTLPNEKDEHIQFQQNLQQDMKKIAKQPEVDLHLQLFLHMAEYFRLPVSHTTTNGELYELSEEIGNMFVAKYNELFSIARCHSLDDVLRHQIRLFIHLADSQYLIASKREQMLLQTALLTWIEQLPSLYQDRILELFSREVTQKAMEEVLQRQGIISFFKQLPPSAYDLLSSLLCAVMPLFVPMQHAPSLLVGFNAPLWTLASLESHEIVAKRKEAEPFLPLLATVVHLMWMCKLEHQDELLNYQSLLIKWSSVYHRYEDFQIKKEQAQFDVERLEGLIYNGEQDIKELKGIERQLTKKIDSLKESIRHQLNQMDLKTLNCGLVMKRMVQEHEALKEDVDELKRKLSIKGDIMERIRLTFRSAERIVKSKVKEVERKKILMQMTDFILANRLPICVDIQNEIEELQERLTSTLLKLNQHIELLDETKSSRGLTSGKLKRYEAEIKRLEKVYYGLAVRELEPIS